MRKAKRRNKKPVRSAAETAVRSIINNGEYSGLNTALPSKKEVKLAQRTVKVGKVPLRTYAVFRDQNGIAYLRVGFTENGADFVVNKGFHVELVSIDRRHALSLYLQPVVAASVWQAAKNLLHPLNDNVTISVRAKQHLETILKNEKVKELETMKTKATGNVAKKFATITAPAAKNAKTGHKADASAKSASKTPVASKKAAPASNDALYETRVVATKKATDAREGSFFHTIGKLAAKPIKLSDLIVKAAKEIKLRSEKDATEVMKVRVRDSFTRLGFLKEAK